MPETAFALVPDLPTTGVSTGADAVVGAGAGAWTGAGAPEAGAVAAAVAERRVDGRRGGIFSQNIEFAVPPLLRSLSGGKKGNDLVGSTNVTDFKANATSHISFRNPRCII